MKISIVSGGFDPIHSGHISYIKDASNYGDQLFVCLNSDTWLESKKGKAFMPFHERKVVLESIKEVNGVISFDDSDGSCIDGINKIKNAFPDSEYIFCNGGDRDISNIPEANMENVRLIFEVGGKVKTNSSSLILKNWVTQREKRSWGYFETFHYQDGLKIKELVVYAGQGLSFQRHKFRSELWFVRSGSCKVFIQPENSLKIKLVKLRESDTLLINPMTKHQLINDYENECKIIELQYGKFISENDIERDFYYPITPTTK